MPIPINRMWFEGKLPAFRRNPIIAGAVSVGLIAAALCIKIALSHIPDSDNPVSGCFGQRLGRRRKIRDTNPFGFCRRW